MLIFLKIENGCKRKHHFPHHPTQWKKWYPSPMGHSSYQITMDIYSHVLKKVEQEAADKLEAALFEQNPA